MCIRDSTEHEIERAVAGVTQVAHQVQDGVNERLSHMIAGREVDDEEQGGNDTHHSRGFGAPPGGDGIAAWERLMAAIGREPSTIAAPLAPLWPAKYFLSNVKTPAELGPLTPVRRGPGWDFAPTDDADFEYVIFEWDNFFASLLLQGVGAVALASTLEEAEAKAESGVSSIKGELFHRTDVGTAALVASRSSIAATAARRASGKASGGAHAARQSAGTLAPSGAHRSAARGASTPRRLRRARPKRPPRSGREPLCSEGPPTC